MKKVSKQVKLVLDILQDEVDGDVASALRKMTKDYTMTWMDCGINGKELFPTTTSDLEWELEEAYPIKGRKYEIRNIAEGENVVMVELIESFPDPKTKKVFRTPLVLVLEMKGGKIRTGRHYLDPRLSQKHHTPAQIDKAYKNSEGAIVTIE